MTARVVKRPDRDAAAYDVVIDGEVAGTVYRRDHVTPGYWGRWKAGRIYFTTRRQAVDHIVDRHTQTKSSPTTE